MVVQVAPHPRQIVARGDAERAQLFRRADARSHQQQRRADRPGRQNDTALRHDIALSLPVRNADAAAAGALQDQRQHLGLRHQMQVRTSQRGRKIGIRDGLALAVLDGEGVEARAAHPRAVVILGRRDADFFARRHIGPRHRMRVRRPDQMQRAANRVIGGRARRVVFRAQEIGHQVGIAPAGVSLCDPGVEIGRVAAHMRHGVERGGAADHLAPRPVVDAVRRVTLRDGAIGPVDRAALQQRPLRRVGDARIGGGTARLDQPDLESGILAQTRGQHRSRGA